MALATLSFAVRRATDSLGRLRTSAGRAADIIAAAALVPGVFRRESTADRASLVLQQRTTAITTRAFARDTEADRASRRLQERIAAEQVRPFAVRPGDPRLSMFGPFPTSITGVMRRRAR